MMGREWKRIRNANGEDEEKKIEKVRKRELKVIRGKKKRMRNEMEQDK